MIGRAPSIEIKGARFKAAHPVGSAYVRLLARGGLHTALSKAAAVASTQNAPGGRSFSEAADRPHSKLRGELSALQRRTPSRQRLRPAAGTGGLVCSRAQQGRSRRVDAERARRPLVHGDRRMSAPAPSIEVNGPCSDAAHPVGSPYARLLAREGVHAAAPSEATTTALTRCTACRLLPEAAE